MPSAFIAAPADPDGAANAFSAAWLMLVVKTINIIATKITKLNFKNLFMINLLLSV
jgi:hypothetical protein